MCIKKLTIFILALVLIFFSFACDNTGSNVDEENVIEYYEISDKTGYSKSALLEYTYPSGMVTGVASPNYSEITNVGGTDLGFPVYDDKNDRMYFFFGDSFSGYGVTADGDYGVGLMGGKWRSQTVGYVDNFSTSNFYSNHKFTGWLTDSNGQATAVIEGVHNSACYDEGTKIPTGGICIDGTVYLFYMSIQYFSKTGGKWFVNYSGVVKSSDMGKTWSRVFDLTWFSNSEQGKKSYANGGPTGTMPMDFDETQYISQVTSLAARDVDKTLNYEFTEDDYNDRIAPNFMQIAAVDGKDGYIYIYGCQGGREDGMQMGRVLKDNFEKFDEYEYFTGYDSSKNPTWKTYKEGGLSEISTGIKINSLSTKDGNINNAKYNNSENSTFIISNAQCGESTVFYNPYLGKWILSGNYMNEIYIYISSNVYGPFTKRQVVFGTDYDYSTHQKFASCDYDYQKVCSEFNAFRELYGGLGHEKLCNEDGTMGLMISYMDKIYNSLILEIKFY